MVTGSGGFIGQHLVRHLRSEGIEVLGIDRGQDAEHLETVDKVVDLKYPGVLERYLDNRTAIFHMAGSADVRASVTAPYDDFQDNVILALNILESARKVGCTLLFPSTGSVYDPRAPLPFGETTPLRPSSPYGAAKLALEAYGFAYHRSYAVDIRIARMFSVFGPGMRRFAIYDFFHRLKENPKALIIRGDGGQSRDYLYVDDVVRALLLIADKGTPGEVYNVAMGRSYTILEVARSIASTMGLHNCEVTPDGASFEAELYKMEADISKLQYFDFRPRVTFIEGLKRTVAWLEDQNV